MGSNGSGHHAGWRKTKQKHVEYFEAPSSLVHKLASLIYFICQDTAVSYYKNIVKCYIHSLVFHSDMLSSQEIKWVVTLQNAPGSGGSTHDTRYIFQEKLLRNTSVISTVMRGL